jgi:phosphohistidine phosphatase SixA
METTHRSRLLLLPGLLLALCAAVSAASPAAASLSGRELAAALEGGGYVILMRHASSPPSPPEPSQAAADNLRHERQLDVAGRDAALAMGDALHRLRIPIGKVLSSPAYRALETARLARLGEPQTLVELGDAGQSRGTAGRGRGGWLRAQVAQAPDPGTDTIIVTHAPNIGEAFPAALADLAEGGALIFHPDGHGGAALVARVNIGDWPRMAAAPP